MTYKERQELNQLSKEVFGTSSKWQKLVNNGFAEDASTSKDVMIPKANGKVVKKTFVDRKSVTKRYTVEEIRKIMTDVLEAKKAAALNAANAQLVQTVESPTVEDVK